MDLYDITLQDAAKMVIDDIVATFPMKKSEARKLLANALVYNVVIEEIKGQIAYLIGEDY